MSRRLDPPHCDHLPSRPSVFERVARFLHGEKHSNDSDDDACSVYGDGIARITTATDDADVDHPLTVVFFGTTGVGKSSVVNLLKNSSEESDHRAKVESSTSGVTRKAEKFSKVVGGKAVNVFDTIGTGEGQQGAVPTDKAIEAFFEVLRDQPYGVNLVVLVMRGGRLTKMEENNYGLIRLLCGEQTPIALVVTGLEQEEDIDGWWTMHGKHDYFRVQGHACVVATEGRNQMLLPLYEQSKTKVEELIVNTKRTPGHKIEATTRMETFMSEIRSLVGSTTDELHEKLYLLLQGYGVGKQKAKKLARKIRPGNAH